MFTRILVPTDFSERSDSALMYAQRIATRFGASIHLLHVIDDPLAEGVFEATAGLGKPAFTADHPDNAMDMLRARCALVRDSGLRTTFDILHGPCASTILTHAERSKADLIVMGTHGRTGVAHALLGSVAERVVRTAPCPVLTVHAGAQQVTDALMLAAYVTAAI